MTNKIFSIVAVLKEGWELTKNNIAFLVIYQIIWFIAAYIFLGSEWKWTMAPLLVVGWIILILGKMGLFNSVLLLTKGEKPSFDQFYQNWPHFISWVVASILVGLMFFIGLILFIVPGFYVLARFGLFPFFILDKHLGPIEAIRQASQATEGPRIRWQLFLLFLTIIVLNLLGLFIFGVGLLITVPVTSLALAIVYRQLTGQTKESIQPADLAIED